jgi:hypothetical protein
MSLLYWHLRAHGRGLVPRNVSKQLHDFYEANSRRSLFLTGELTRVLHLMEENGIIAIPFKGPALAASAYGDLSLREFTDLDILVQREDVPRARALMGTLGYRPVPSIFDSHMEAYLRSRNELPFVSHDGRFYIELEWEIVPNYFHFPLTSLRLWERCHDSREDEKEFWTIPPEETLLLLCVHGAKHHWERLAWLCDVSELLRSNEDLDWQHVLKMANHQRSLRMLFLGLHLVRDLLGVALPPDILAVVEKDPAIRKLARQVRVRLFKEAHRASNPLRAFLFQLKAKDGNRDRVRCCVGLALTTTPEDMATVNLSASLSPVYHLLRPIRLVIKFLVAPLRHAGHASH